LHEAYRPLYTNVGFSHDSLSKKSVGVRGAPYDSVEGQTRMDSEESDDGIPF